MYTERILIVEDEPVVALDLQQSLQEIGHDVLSICTCFEEVILGVEALMPSLILMDIHLDGDIDGIEACHEIYRRWHIPVIFLTAYADDQTVSRAAETRPFGYVMKPFENKELSAVIQVARARHDAETMLERSEQRLSLALDVADIGIWEWEAQLDQFQGDERFSHIWDVLRPFQATLGAMLDSIHEEEREQVRDMFHEQPYFTGSFRARRQHGGYAWLEIYGKLITDERGGSVVIGVIRDITLQKNMEENLRQAAVVFNTAVEGMMILNADGVIINANPAFYAMTGYEATEVIGRTPQEFLFSRRESDPGYAQIAASKEGVWTGETPCRRRDGRMLPTLQHICVVRNENKVPDQFVVSISDISFIREAERQLEHLAFHDPLTGMGNRYLLDQRLQQEIARAQLSSFQIAVLFIDLDGFKAINDSMGHHIGDRLIQEAARRISGQIRRHDEAIRLGGDEFVVIAPDLHQAAEGSVIAEKILRSMTEPMQIDERQFRIGASIGIARYPGDGRNISELLSAADSAMYEAKRQGKGRTCFYSSDMTDNARTRMNTEQGLHDALERSELVLHYQPVIDIREQRLLGFEALVRWQHPQNGLLGPDQFIPVAEETGLIEPLGQWVMNEALAQLSRWREQGFDGFFMSVNVSPRQFLHDHFLEDVQATLERCRLPASAMEIEITESTLQDFQRSRRIVHEARELGCSIAIDDFGTGYSSIALLKHLPVSRIKIDRSFVMALPSSSRDMGLVSAMMAMANGLGLEVTAEGVETSEHVALLRSLACPAAQGYYFARPAPAASFSAQWQPQSWQ